MVLKYSPSEIFTPKYLYTSYDVNCKKTTDLTKKRMEFVIYIIQYIV